MFFLCTSLQLLAAALPCQDRAPEPRHLFLDNGTIRVGVDLESGGSVFHFSHAPEYRNLLNHHDRGRFVQQSWYGAADGTRWNEKEWCWNPVQGGDWRGNPGRLLERKKTETSLYTKGTPRHWSGCVDLPEVVLEQWIELEGEVAHLRFRFTYEGEIEHPKKHQEMPAIYVDHRLETLVHHEGEKPWTDEALTRLVPGWPNEGHVRGECWSAYVDERNRGLGVFTPGTPEITCFRYEGPPGPKGSGCSYFAPIRTLAITPGLKLEYDVYLTIGEVKEIRARFAEVHRKRSAPAEAEAEKGPPEGDGVTPVPAPDPPRRRGDRTRPTVPG